MKNKPISLPLILAVIGLFDAPKAGASSLAGSFEPREFKDEADGLLHYRLYIPKIPDNAARLPLVLLLHGTSGRGTDNLRQFTGGNAIAAETLIRPDSQQRHPCFIVVPQCPPANQWARTDYNPERHARTPEPGETMRRLIQLLENLIKEYPVDARRVYVAGNSMGGYGAWDIVTRRPDLFAAAVPICGGGDASVAKSIAPLPVWAFHGEDDPIVAADHSRRMVEAIRKAGGRPRHTEYAGAGHDIADRVWREPELLDWMFSQRRHGDAVKVPKY